MLRKFSRTHRLVLIFILVLGVASSVFANQSNPTDARLTAATSALVFQSDFGIKNDAVASMKGVAFNVEPNLKMFDLTHEIPPFDIWEGAYWLNGAAPFWPSGTVFVSIIDPGVGSDRKSVVLKTKTGHYFVTPDNGTLTLVAENLGIEAIRQIDEAVNRLADSEASYTFHGRDVYAYTGARLASGKISFEQVGKLLDSKVETISYQKAEIKDNTVLGMIVVLDQPYGNVWTNIPKKTFESFGFKVGDVANVTIMKEGKKVYEGKIPYVNTFSDVEEGKPLLYMNSELNASFAINMDNFAETNKIEPGSEWSIKITK